MHFTHKRYGISVMWLHKCACTKFEIDTSLILRLHNLEDTCFNTGIKHGFSCINIRQVPWEVLKTEAEGRVFQHLPRDLVNVNALKNHVRSLLLHKNWKHSLHFTLFLALFCFAFSPMCANAISTDYARSGAGQYTLVTAAILWPRYEHTESCVAVH